MADQTEAQTHLEDLRERVASGDVSVSAADFLAAEAAAQDEKPTDFRTADKAAYERELDRLGHFIRRRR